MPKKNPYVKPKEKPKKCRVCEGTGRIYIAKNGKVRVVDCGACGGRGYR